jgi:hypothetical protein
MTNLLTTVSCCVGIVLLNIRSTSLAAEPVRLQSTMNFPVDVRAASAGGIAFDGKSLWVSVQSVRAPDRLMKYSMEGKRLSDVALTSGNIGGGLAYDGNELHVLDYRTRHSGNGAIHRVNAEGKIVKSHELPKDQFNTFGLTYAQKSIYYGHSPTVRPMGTIYKISAMLQKSEVVKVDFYVRGLAFDGESFWVSTTKEIHRVDEKFNILATYIPDKQAADLAWADGALWAVEHNQNRVHRFDIPKDIR